MNQLSQCGCRDENRNVQDPTPPGKQTSFQFSPEDSCVLRTGGNRVPMPGRRQWQALGVAICGSESCKCLSVALPLQVTCSLALGFMLLFFFSRRAVGRISKMLFVTWITTFQARGR